jgi:Mg2+-importing ATPase
MHAISLAEAAGLDVDHVLTALATSRGGLAAAGLEERRRTFGSAPVSSEAPSAWTILLRQLNNPLLILMVVTCGLSLGFGQKSDAAIILAIVTFSLGLGFFDEYRSERAVADLKTRIRRTATVLRDGVWAELAVAELVPGDIVRVGTGDVVPADVRLIEVHDLECDEAILTGESEPGAKTIAPVLGAAAAAVAPASCALMGTNVRTGWARGVVVTAGSATAFGAIAGKLSSREPETAFQAGLRDFSRLLVTVTIVLTGSIFILNAFFGRPVLESLLFSLAIAVGLTPQLLPAIVTVTLATGARRLVARSVIVKRLVCIEDLGNVEVLFTDKTGTLTEGDVAFEAALDASGAPSETLALFGLLSSDASIDRDHFVSGSELDKALWDGAASLRPQLAAYKRIDNLPFDHDRLVGSVLVDGPDGLRRLISKGAPEAIFTRCASVSPEAHALVLARFDAGSRIVAVAARPAPELSEIHAADEHGLELLGFLAFVDRPKADAAESLARLARLGIDVKIITGDNERVAAHVCRELGLPVAGVLTGAQISALSDAALAAAIPQTTIFARVGPEQKERIIHVQRSLGRDVGFLGDGVNDALALHEADVGISVATASDVAKDAADVVLLEKDLGILADGVMEGRRIFANTMKYVLMGTSSNFGNMFSAAGASLFLSFLPMLPSQILLNNLLYDVSEMTIPTDNVDEERLARPSAWDVKMIRRFMLVFGPVSSLFDFATFGVMLFIFHAGPALFRSGWFVESLATQSLVIFVIRTRRIPFLRSRPSTALLLTTFICVAIGAALPFAPFARALDFTPLPPFFFAILGAMIALYLVLVEVTKAFFYRMWPAA